MSGYSDLRKIVYKMIENSYSGNGVNQLKFLTVDTSEGIEEYKIACNLNLDCAGALSGVSNWPIMYTTKGDTIETKVSEDVKAFFRVEIDPSKLIYSSALSLYPESDEKEGYETLVETVVTNGLSERKSRGRYNIYSMVDNRDKTKIHFFVEFQIRISDDAAWVNVPITKLDVKTEVLYGMLGDIRIDPSVSFSTGSPKLIGSIDFISVTNTQSPHPVLEASTGSEIFVAGTAINSSASDAQVYTANTISYSKIDNQNVSLNLNSNESTCSVGFDSNSKVFRVTFN